MREFDSRATAFIPEMILMENAGRCIAEHILRDLRAGSAAQPPAVIFLVGHGHNGGDALVAARHLNDAGVPARAYISPSQLKPLTHTMLNALDSSMTTHIALDNAGCGELITLLGAGSAAHVFADAFLGSGINRPMASKFFDLPQLVRAWNASAALRYAIDVPSGAGAGLAAAAGADGSAGVGGAAGAGVAERWPVFAADHTLAIQFPRDILFTEPLRSLCGDIHCLEIGFPAALLREYLSSPREHGIIPILECDDVETYMPALPTSAHKGTRGKVEVFAGSPGMGGAALLSARAALHSGAGLVRLACSYSDLSAMVLEHEPALMTNSDNKPSTWADCLLAGPGWGSGKEEILGALLDCDLPLLVDADGLAALKTVHDSRGTGYFRQRKAELVLTPHPGEAARFLDKTAEEIMRSPFESAAAIAERYHAWVILKSAVSFISDPAGRLRMFDGQNPALATAGSGDVLAGIAAGLLARGLSADDASAASVLLHASAGRHCFASRGWFSANQLLDCLAQLAGDIQHQHSTRTSA